jgi:formate-dependent nitrite reductase cytochrome c552 subunit
MRNSTRRLIVLLVGAGITFILAGMVPLVFAQAEPTATAEASAGTPEAGIQPTGDNSYCAVCHNQPWRTVPLADGSILNLFVDPIVLKGSIHSDLGCVDCHGQDAFPHNKPSPVSSRAYTLETVEICASCHEDQIDELEMGLHAEAIRAGNIEAAVCTDCHGAHNVQQVAAHPELVAGVCGDCHTIALAEWRASAHVDIGPLGCATCHSPHTQQIRAGDTPEGLCANCHNDMPELWVHTQHEGNDYAVGCADCHMYTGEGSPSADVTDDVTGHTMLLDSKPCNTCHELLVTNPDVLANEVRPTEAVEPESATVPEVGAEPPPDQGSFVQLLQGLILGLGFGITGAAVFITRGNRRKE